MIELSAHGVLTALYSGSIIAWGLYVVWAWARMLCSVWTIWRS